jgi:hypothetical protein
VRRQSADPVRQLRPRPGLVDGGELVDAGEYVLLNPLPVSGEQGECARDEFSSIAESSVRSSTRRGSLKLGVVA